MSVKIRTTPAAVSGHGINPGLLFLFGLLILGIVSEGQGEAVDGIAAVVGGEVITLTDVKIARDFGLFNLDSPGQTLSFDEVLEGLIDQKVVLEMTSETLALSPAEIANVFEVYLIRLERQRWEELLRLYDLSPEDFKQILHDTLLYSNIIQQKFSREAIVNLQEIESYYQGVYLQRINAQGREPQAVTEVLDEIESAIKFEKNRSRIREWIGNLRRQAEIQVFSRKFPAYFKGEKQKISVSLENLDSDK